MSGTILMRSGRLGCHDSLDLQFDNWQIDTSEYSAAEPATQLTSLLAVSRVVPRLRLFLVLCRIPDLLSAIHLLRALCFASLAT